MGEVRTLPVSDRGQLAALLDQNSAKDALAAHYALHHDPSKVRLFSYHGSAGDLRGFVAIAQTGIDLFRPLVVPFVATQRIMARLMRDALRVDQPVLISLPADQADWLKDWFALDDRRELELLRMEAEAFEPILNVLVVEAEAPDGLPRYEIRTADGTKVAAGTNWISGSYADVYVDGQAMDGRVGLTRSVLSALCARLLGRRLVALFRVDTRQVGLKTEALKVGFRPTGRREGLMAGKLLPRDLDSEGS